MNSISRTRQGAEARGVWEWVKGLEGEREWVKGSDAEREARAVLMA
jgi:hypothetical protein